jgi:hypothetical protein
MPFNLFVAWKQKPWISDFRTWELDRVFEQSDPHLVAQVNKEFDRDSIEKLMGWPCLFVDELEQRDNNPAEVGKIVRITRKDNEIQVKRETWGNGYRFPAEKVAALAWNLGIRENQLKRSHWALKDVNLVAVLQEHNLISSGLPIELLTEFDANTTVEEAKAATRREIEAGHYDAAIDRLHTYCVMTFRSLLLKRKIEFELKHALHSLSGQYFRGLLEEKIIERPVYKVVSKCSSALEEFDNIRNNHSLAHSNTLLPNAQARMICEIIFALLSFVNSVESKAADQ